ncbi:MAG: biotin carboxylase N-terminal domain-containing protein [Kofleriaceae bacterium]
MGAVSKVLIANRGEIACRIIATCRAMGLGTVAVYSDADRRAPHVALADVAVRLGPAPARASYLSIERVLAAAAATGADAVHPGYGFLSENADFAEACAQAGLTFIGPSAAVIRQLGSKRDAKRIAVDAGVPVVPGYAGDDQSTEALVAAAAQIGYPLLVKASAGGGGKGMRVVRAEAELAEALARARGEAAAAFGDDTLLLERYLERPRHVEIQLLGDHHGAVVALGERECSIQRRHQKVIEEAPSPTIDDATRAGLAAAAVAVGRAVGYASAGTVEFIVDERGAFYFLEVNTRLQVEHRVTEAVLGLDLVREQIRIARGEPLGYAAAPPVCGHAIEVRLYAEDADRDHVPQPGTALAVELPTPEGVLVDVGLVAGGAIGLDYDPMIAKVVAHGATRAEATARLGAALGRAYLPGLTTNAAYLRRVLALPAFADRALHTHFLDEHAAALAPPPVADARLGVAVFAAALAEQARHAAGATPAVPAGWRNVPHGVHATGTRVTFVVGERALAVGRRALGDGRVRLELDGAVHEVTDVACEGDRVAFTATDGVRWTSRVTVAGDDDARVHWVWIDGDLLALREAPRFPRAAATVEVGGLRAPMPGKVVALATTVGATVAAGDVLVVLEAMKMEHPVRAPHAGVVASIAVAVGDQVDGGAPLATVDAPAG